MTMNAMPHAARPAGFRHPLLAGFAVALTVLLTVVPASAQLSRVSPSSGPSAGLHTPGGVLRGTDVAWDPVHQIYLVIGGYGSVYGMFVNTTGAVIGSVFTIHDGSVFFAHFPRAEFSPDINNGGGGFLVSWHDNAGAPIGGGAVANVVKVRTVAYPSAAMSVEQTLSDSAQLGTYWEDGAAVAYSTTSHKFLVVWETHAWGVQGRFVDAAGTPLGSVIPIETPGGAMGL